VDRTVQGFGSRPIAAHFRQQLTIQIETEPTWASAVNEGKGKETGEKRSEGCS